MALIPKSGMPRVLALEVTALLAATLAAIPFAVWRGGRAALPLVALALCVTGVAIALVAAVAAFRARRRLPALDLGTAPLGPRLAAAAPELLVSAGFAGIWCAAGLLPAEAPVVAELLMPLEALALLGACVLVPVVLARARRLGDAVAFGLIASLGAALTWALAERAGPVAWGVFGALALWRGLSLERERRREPSNEQERWLLALAVLVASYWLATLAAALVPLPAPGWLYPVRGGAELPEPWLLLWGLAHFAVLGFARVRRWPGARAEQEPPPPPRAFATGRKPPK